MIDFGYTLQKAREDKGFTIHQIAEITHMLPQQVEDLEHENFSRIAAPIYGRGFVKLYCDAVGLEPKPLVDEFMEIYNGNRLPSIRTRPRATVIAADPLAEAAAPTPAPESAPAHEAAGDQIEEGEIEDQLPPVAAPSVPEPEAPAPAPQPVPPAAPSCESASTPGIVQAATQENSSMDAFQFEPPAQRAATAPASPLATNYPSYAAPARQPEPAVQFAAGRAPAHENRYSSPAPKARRSSVFDGFSIPPAVWRILILIIVASAILWCVFKICSAIYRVATTPPAQEEQTANKPATQEIGADLPGRPEPLPTKSPAPAPDAKPSTRTPIPIPPLYID